MNLERVPVADQVWRDLVEHRIDLTLYPIWACDPARRLRQPLSRDVQAEGNIRDGGSLHLRLHQRLEEQIAGAGLALQ